MEHIPLADLGIDTDGDLTAPLDTSQKCTLRRRCRRHLRITQEVDQAQNPHIVRTTFNRECSLTDGGENHGSRENRTNTITKPKAFQSGCRKDDCIELPRIELRKTCIDIAAQVKDRKIWAHGKQLCTSPKTRCADLRPLWELLHRSVMNADKGIPRIQPLRDRTNDEPRRDFRRHILQAVHGEIDLPRQHRLLKLLCEEPLAPDLCERSIEDAIALCRHFSERHTHSRMMFFNLCSDVFCLPQSKLTCPRTDSDCVAVHLYLSLLSHPT